MFHVFVINRIGHSKTVTAVTSMTSAVGLTEPGEATEATFCETDGGSRLMTAVTSMTSSAVGLTEPGEATEATFCETDGGSRLMTAVTSMTSSAVGLTEPGEASGTCAVGPADFAVTQTSFCETENCNLIQLSQPGVSNYFVCN